MSYDKHYIIASVLIVVLILLSIFTFTSTGAVVSGNGGLIVISSPSLALIKIDGIITGSATPYTTTLSSGEHTITLSKRGFRDYTKTLTINNARTTTLNVVLKADPQLTTPTTGTLDVKSTPTGATVYVEGISIGTTPLTRQIALGLLRVRIEKLGYATRGLLTTIDTEGTTNITVRLIRTSNFRIVFANSTQFSTTDAWNYHVWRLNRYSNNHILIDSGIINPRTTPITTKFYYENSVGMLGEVYFNPLTTTVNGTATRSNLSTRFMLDPEGFEKMTTITILSGTFANGTVYANSRVSYA